MAWVHPPVVKGLFQGAFTSTNVIALSPWTNPPAGASIPTNLVIVEVADNIPVATNNFSLAVTNRTLTFGKASGASLPLTGSITAKTGLVKVTFGTGRAKITGYAVVLLNGTNGGGYFLTTTNSGAIILQP